MPVEEGSPEPNEVDAEKVGRVSSDDKAANGEDLEVEVEVEGKLARVVAVFGSGGLGTALCVGVLSNEGGDGAVSIKPCR